MAISISGNGRTAFGPAITRDGLILYLDAANTKSYAGTGTVWRDISGKGNNGTLVNGPTYNSANSGSIVFDGSNDSVDISHASSPISNLSYEIFCRIDSIPASNTFRSIWQKSENWNGSTGISLQMIYGILSFSYGANWGGSTSCSLSLLTVGNWYHIVGTVPNTSTGSTARLYLNGSLVGTGTNTTTPTTTSILQLGKGSGGVFIGNISLFRCYNRQLSSTEIIQNYNAIKSRFGLS